MQVLTDVGCQEYKYKTSAGVKGYFIIKPGCLVYAICMNKHEIN